MKAEINVEFNEASDRQEIQSGEEIKTLFGKLKKWLSDLKPIAFSGNYNDLSDTPSSLPADGGEAEKAVSDSTGADIAESFAKVKSNIALNRTTLGTQCKNLFKNTAVSQTAYGVTFTVNDDKSIIVDGTATRNIYFNIGEYYFEADKQYILNGCPSGGSGTKYFLAYNGMAGHQYDTGSGTIFSVNESVTKAMLLVIVSGQTVSNLTFYPMLRYADILDDTYEPYQPSLKEELESLIVDSAMSDTSENPVQNKVIKAYIDQKIAEISGS